MISVSAIVWASTSACRQNATAGEYFALRLFVSASRITSDKFPMRFPATQVGNGPRSCLPITRRFTNFAGNCIALTARRLVHLLVVASRTCSRISRNLTLLVENLPHLTACTYVFFMDNAFSMQVLKFVLRRASYLPSSCEVLQLFSMILWYLSPPSKSNFYEKEFNRITNLDETMSDVLTAEKSALGF